MRTLLGLLIGNLSALLVHGLAWKMRKKCLWLLIILGVLCILIFLAVIFFICSWNYNPDGFEPGVEEPIGPDWRSMISIWGIAFVLTSICAAIQRAQIPALWWKAFLALWGEIFLLCGLCFLLDSRIPFNSPWLKWIDSLVFGYAYFVVWILLALLRPFVVRWIHPVWQLMLNPGKPITENHD